MKGSGFIQVNCKACGAGFARRDWPSHVGRTGFCSRACRLSHRLPQSLGEPFVCARCKEEVAASPLTLRNRVRWCDDCLRSAQRAGRNARGTDSARQREWRTAHPGKVAEYQRRWRAANPQKTQAHQALKLAIRKGIVQREACAECGATRVDAHHDDYSKPLDVKWLCRPCHTRQHRKTA